MPTLDANPGYQPWRTKINMQNWNKGKAKNKQYVIQNFISAVKRNDLANSQTILIEGKV